MKKAYRGKWIAFSLAALLLGGCTNVVQPNLVEDHSYQRTKTGALLGAVAGAVTGLVTASKKHRARDALVGAAAGAAVGGGVGYLLDRQANEVARALGTRVDNDPLAQIDPKRDLVVSKTDRYVKILFRDRMMFAFGSDQLQPSAREKVKKVGALLRNYPQTIVQVAGFTDNVGSLEVNQRLSKRRAENVAQVLRSMGIRNTITTRGCAYNKPLVPNNTPEQRALNRRVEVYLYNRAEDVVDPCRY